VSEPRRRRATTGAPRPDKPARLGRWPLVRMQVTAGAVALLFAGLGYTAWGLQVRRNEHFRDAAEKQHLSSVELPAPRGVIRDRVGRELAVTADASSVYANPRKVEGVASTAETLAKLLGQDVRGLEEKLSSSRHFVWLKRHVTDDVAKQIEAAKLAGVHITAEPRRYYPGQTLAGPILGFANIDGAGIEGTELAMDELLRGHKAKRAALRDATGKLMLTEDGDEIEPRPGATVVLTIDRYIQFVAERALERSVTEHRAKAGSIVVLDVASAEVLAMANWPTYDPNEPAGRDKARNRVITDAFEMGSVMKVFTVSGALEQGAVKPTDTFDIEKGRLRIGRKLIRDSYHDEVLDVGGILKRSSNVGTIKIARKLGKTGLYETLKTFGFGRTTGIELPGERGGLMHPTSRWGEIGLAAVSYGYMTMVTPLQVAAGYAAIGNGGMYNEPRVIKEVRDPASGEILYHHELEPRRVLSKRTTDIILPMLSKVFEKGKHGGTARSVEIDGYHAGGKTGTSHKIDPATKKYADHLYLSTFAGLAPIEDPKIVVVVLIDEPGGEEYYGAKVAGPAFAEVVGETLRYLGVPADESAPTDEDGDEMAEERGLPHSDVGESEASATEAPAPAETETETEAPPAPAPGSIPIPDFRGLTVAQALDVARRHHLPVIVEGSGRAVEQSPLPGYAGPGSECRIVFAPEER